MARQQDDVDLPVGYYSNVIVNSRPDLVEDGQTLSSISNNTFNHWRYDPPYNAETARKMYCTCLSEPAKLLKAGARLCKVGSLTFLLLGPKYYQICP
ncbi:MAG: hypothetical protein WBY71_00560, partial [Nitrososphaeraceae archaeon]